jgi:hypothetical protein
MNAPLMDQVLSGLPSEADCWWTIRPGERAVTSLEVTVNALVASRTDRCHLRKWPTESPIAPTSSAHPASFRYCYQFLQRSCTTPPATLIGSVSRYKAHNYNNVNGDTEAGQQKDADEAGTMGEFQEAPAALLGRNAPNLSPAVICRNRKYLEQGAVIVGGDLDVIIDADAACPPFGKDLGLDRQRLQRRTIDLFEQFAGASRRAGGLEHFVEMPH